MPKNRKKILVTGGAGFIGSHLCEALLKAGHEVICLDNFFTGNGRNIAHLIREKRFRFAKRDVENKYFYQVDRIYNLACPAAPVWYKKDPVKTVRTNVMGAINALELARKLGCRALLASTSEVYGDPAVHPQTEAYWGNVNPIGPRACYDEGKRCAETLFFDYWREYGVDIRVARIFNTYGPRMAVEDGRVVNNFIIQALRGENLTVYGRGRQTRSFCYIDDMVRGLMRLMETSGVTGPVNLGNPEELTVGELARKVIALTGSRSRIKRRPLPADDPAKRKPDITRARKVLGWRPEIGLEEGLARTIAYFRTVI